MECAHQVYDLWTAIPLQKTPGILLARQTLITHRSMPDVSWNMNAYTMQAACACCWQAEGSRKLTSFSCTVHSLQ